MSGQPSSHPTPAPLGEGLCECPDCGLFQTLPRLRPGLVADCGRCGAVLRRRRRNSFSITLALMLTGLALFAITTFAPLMSFRFAGQQQTASLPDLPLAFREFGMWQLSLVILATIIVAPLLKLMLTACVLLGLRGRVAPSTLAAMARIRSWLTPWSMTEVFLLGLFVAYTRLSAIATVQIGTALYAMAGLMLVMVGADAWLDEHAMWEAISRRRRTPAAFGTGAPIGCDTCGQVSRAEPGEPCPRCNSTLRIRKPEPVARCWALLIAAAILYIPSNILPVMTVVRLGRGHPSTIMGGVQELIEYHMWPLALLVFVASIVVPMMKLMLLAFMLISTQRRSTAQLLGRTRIYRLVDVIGRWSMIDVFMVTILTALVQMGLLASVTPGYGAVCFAGVVVLTMLAAFSFDPRLMWDAAGARAGSSVGLGAGPDGPLEARA
ncbi:MAG: PqiA/YebS family transporter subunit [Acetobacteraceae bacterium]